MRKHMRKANLNLVYRHVFAPFGPWHPDFTIRTEGIFDGCRPNFEIGNKDKTMFKADQH